MCSSQSVDEDFSTGFLAGWGAPWGEVEGSETRFTVQTVAGRERVAHMEVVSTVRGVVFVARRAGGSVFQNIDFLLDDKKIGFAFGGI